MIGFPHPPTPEDLARWQEEQKEAMQQSVRHQAAIALLTALAIRSDENDLAIAKRAVKLSALFVNELFAND